MMMTAIFCVLRGSSGRAPAAAAAPLRMRRAGDHTQSHDASRFTKRPTVTPTVSLYVQTASFSRPLYSAVVETKTVVELIIPLVLCFFEAHIYLKDRFITRYPKCLPKYIKSKGV